MIKRTLSTSLSFRLQLLMASFIILLTITLTASAVISASERIWKHQAELLGSTAARISDHIDQSLLERLSDVRQLVNLNLLSPDAIADASLRDKLDGLASTLPEYAWIGLTDSKGKVLFATKRMLEGANVSARPWWNGGRLAPYIGDIHGAKLLEAKLGIPGGAPLRFVDVAAPVLGAQNQFRGVVGAHLYSSWVDEIIASVLKPLTNAGEMQVAVLNRHNEVIIGSPSVKVPNLHEVNSGEVRILSSDKLQVWRSEVDGVTALAEATGFRDFAGLGWRVIVQRPYATVIKPVVQLQQQLVLRAVIVAVIFLALTFWLTRWLVKPLRVLKQQLAATSSPADLQALQISGSFQELDAVVAQLEVLAGKLYNRDAALHKQRLVAQQQALAIQSLTNTALTDPLTGALNRRGMQDRLQRLSESLEKYPRPVGVIAFDIDHFKAINDSYGHAIGDKVLQTVVNATSELIRATDIFVRSGGEEFILIVPEVDDLHCHQLAERLCVHLEPRCRLENLAYDLRVTASFGVAHGGAAGGVVDLEDLLGEADRQSYAAKRAGRNRVMPPLPATSDNPEADPIRSVQN